MEQSESDSIRISHAHMYAHIHTQEGLVEQLESDMSQELRRMMMNLENMRVRYLLKMYHRTRLKKIEKFAASIAADDEADDKLSGWVVWHVFCEVEGLVSTESHTSAAQKTCREAQKETSMPVPVQLLAVCSS